MKSSEGQILQANAYHVEIPGEDDKGPRSLDGREPIQVILIAIYEHGISRNWNNQLHPRQGDASDILHTYRLSFKMPDYTTNQPETANYTSRGFGLSYHYTLPNLRLSATHRVPVILHDQLGNGRSTHLPDNGIDDNFDFLGYSWGGMHAI
ncbi:proline-specific peptidase, partial [Moniliophthora roreri]